MLEVFCSTIRGVIIKRNFMSRLSTGLLLGLLVCSGLLLSGCQKTTTVDQSQNSTPKIYTDQAKFASAFTKCEISELRMPFGGTATYYVKVSGVTDDKCGYQVQVRDVQGKPASGPPDLTCNMPTASLTQDTLLHLFGYDKAAGKEAVKAEQDQLEAMYCQIE
jgi:hypothetical protein